MGTAPQPAALTGGRLGPLGWLRWGWRQLTSMRTALLLLCLLAVASIPGSVLPQRGTDPAKVSQYLAEHGSLGRALDRAGMFDVFAAPWFAAIYLLLCVSLLGCVLPRARQHALALRAKPPAAPSRLTRFPGSASWVSEQAGAPDLVLAAAERELRSQRWRVRGSEFDGQTGWVAAEKGYLRETGNLLFHVALVALLFAVGFGSLFGWKGQILVTEQKGFANTLTQYDSFTPGRLVDIADLPPFSFTLDDFSATYQSEGTQQGAPREFSADVTYQGAPGEPSRQAMISVNSPLTVDGAKVFLIGHGYAPRIQVRDARGDVVYDDTTVFLPQDGNFTSSGVVKMPDLDPQLGLQAIFLPTVAVDQQRGPHSIFPAANDPALFLAAWQGNLGLDNGVAQSVYKLNTADLKRLGIKALRPGETWALPDGAGTVEFAGLSEFATFNVAYDPGKEPALAAAVIAIVGLLLSLFIVRRRVWVRVSQAGGDRTLIEVAGLARTGEDAASKTVGALVTSARDTAPPIQPGPGQE